MSDSIFTSRNAGVFVQFVPGKKPYFLGDCVDLDSIPNPRTGGIELTQCWNRRRDGYITRAKKKSPPGPIEFTITRLQDTAASWLERVHCPFTIYAILTRCGEPGVFSNWEMAAIVQDTEIIDDPITGIAHHSDENDTMHEYSLSGITPRIDPRPLSVGRMSDYAGTRALNSLSPCGNLVCGDNCGAQVEPCDNIVVAGDGAGGAKPDVEYKGTAGTWSAAANLPFANSENVASVVCFDMGSGSNRWLAARATVPGEALKVSYTDDNGATAWTPVTVGSTLGEGATGPKSLFVLDHEHIWVCTDSGQVYFSDDGGETWESQNATGASGANDLNAINFSDEQIGYAVGDSDTVIGTTNGGATWSAKTATGTGDNLTTVTTFSRYRVLVGTDNSTAGGSLWYTFDGTATWEERDFIGHATEGVVDFDFINDYVGLMITGLSTSASDAASIHHTIDGGYSWKELPVDDNSGLNAIIMCDVNQGYAVGEVHSGTAVVLNITG